MRLRLAALWLLFWGSACFHSSDEGKPVALQVETESHLIWKLEESVQLSAYTVDAGGNKTAGQATPVWTSSDESIASVDANGLVTAHKVGQVTINVSTGDFKESVTILIDLNVKEVSVKVSYEDRLYGANGFYANAYKVVRYAEVEILNEGSLLISKGVLDGSGTVSATVPVKGDIGIRVKSQINNSTIKLSVHDLSKNLFSVYKPLAASSESQTSFEVNIPLSVEVTGAFNILDVFALGSEFVQSFNSTAVTDLKVYWEPGSLSGTFYCANIGDPACRNGNGIYVLSQTGADTDEYDDDVLLHEFGHYVATLVSRDDSPGGCHFFANNDLDLRLSWSEGWGDFFPMAVKNWARQDASRASLLSMNPDITASNYIDTYQDQSQLSFDVANLQNTVIDENTHETLAAVHVYSSSELAVNKILWELQEQFGMSAIWQVVDDYLPALGPNLYVNLESFWDGWLETQTPDASALTALQTIYDERKVYFRDDDFENDDTTGLGRKLALDTAESHTLYNSGKAFDIDYVGFDVVAGQRYEVRTDKLSSGADTFIRVVDDAGVTVSIAGAVLENDDWQPKNAYEFSEPGCGYVVSNNDIALSSRLEFVAEQNKSYHVEVQNTAARDTEYYPSAGRYGSYELKVRKLQ
ncbi:MAG: Ig-like domain-containing protein [Gammaproteobacteria bacterium]|nr:Ig-like domain-containing protein [Gammaproteobacteria bacterium]